MAFILRRAWMEMINVFAGGASTPLSGDLRFDDGITAECLQFKGTALLSRSEQLWLTSCHRLRRALAHVDAGPEGNNRVVWTSLREVCFVETV